MTKYRHVYAHRKPLSCINSGPNYVSESTSDDSPQKLNIKLRFDDDYLLSQSDDTSFVDDEITFKKVCTVHMFNVHYFCWVLF